MKYIYYVLLFIILSSIAISAETKVDFDTLGNEQAKGCGTYLGVYYQPVQALTFPSGKSIVKYRIGLGTKTGSPASMQICLNDEQNTDTMYACSNVIPAASINNTYLTFNYFPVATPINLPAGTHYMIGICDYNGGSDNRFTAYIGTQQYTGGSPYLIADGIWGNAYPSNLNYDFAGGFYYDDEIPDSAGTPPDLNLTWDAINGTIISSNNITVNYSGVVFNASDIFNCSIYLDNTLNLTDNDVNISVLQNFDIVTPYLVPSWVNTTLNCTNNDVFDNSSVLLYFNYTRYIPDEGGEENETSGEFCDCYTREFDLILTYIEDQEKEENNMTILLFIGLLIALCITLAYKYGKEYLFFLSFPLSIGLLWLFISGEIFESYKTYIIIGYSFFSLLMLIVFFFIGEGKKKEQKKDFYRDFN